MPKHLSGSKRAACLVFFLTYLFSVFFHPLMVLSQEQDFNDILKIPDIIEEDVAAIENGEEDYGTKDRYKKPVSTDRAHFPFIEHKAQYTGSYSPLPHIDRFRLKVSIKKLFGLTKSAEGDDKCLVCHRGIEEISKNHILPCHKCHKGNPNTSIKSKAHTDMVSNPSALGYAKEFCGECHNEIVENVKKSLMASAANEINRTRYQWGAQDSFEPLYGIKESSSLKALPDYNTSHNEVDDMLRKKCLRCHLYSEGPNRRGEYRSSGCSACHMLYSSDGKTKTQDMAIQKIQGSVIEHERYGTPPKINSRNISGINTKRGYPVLHSFTAAVPSIQCVRCHSGNRTGTEYMGLFEYSGAKEFNPTVVSEQDDNIIFGSRQHALMPDIHFSKGLHCIDCHTQTNRHLSVTVRCEDCHGTVKNQPKTSYILDADYELRAAKANPVYELKIGDNVLETEGGIKLGHIKKTDNDFILTSKVTGKEHKIPVLAQLPMQPISHKVPLHMKKVECHVCHSAWTSYTWGLSMTKDADENSEEWKGIWFVDPQLQYIQTSSGSVKNKMFDWLSASQKPSGISGKMTKGVWWDITALKEWSGLIGMINSRGKVSAARPSYNWDVKGILKKKNRFPLTAFVPYTPHTQQRHGRMCEACHRNRSFAGFGGDKRLKGADRVVNIRGDSIKVTTEKGGRFFNLKEIQNLSRKSKRYRYYRYIDLKERGWERLLTRISYD